VNASAYAVGSELAEEVRRLAAAALRTSPDRVDFHRPLAALGPFASCER